MHERAEPVQRREWSVLLGAVLVSLLIHGIFVMDGFGEPDACRLAIHAASWHATGRQINPGYTFRTSPLYIHAMKKWLDAGFSLESVEALMNWSNVILGSAVLVPLYVLFRRLAGARAAAVGCLLYWFTPTFWQSNNYGMPHVPSFFCLVVSLLSFLRMMEAQSGWKILYSLVSLLFAMLVVELKADVALCFGAFLGMLYYFRAWKVGPVLMSILVLPGISAGAVLLHRQWIAPAMAGTAQFAGQWRQDWPVTLESILNFRSLAIPATSAGGVFYAMVWISVIYMLMRPERRRLLILAAIWALPAMLFWSLRAGNSARHLMVSYSVVMLLVSVMLTDKFLSRKSLAWTLVILIGVNYFANTSKNWGFHVGGRLIESRMAMQGIVNNFKTMGQELIQMPCPRKLLHEDEGSCYLIWEALKDAKCFTAAYPGYYEYEITRREGEAYRLRDISASMREDPAMKGWCLFDFNITGFTASWKSVHSD